MINLKLEIIKTDSNGELLQIVTLNENEILQLKQKLNTMTQDYEELTCKGQERAELENVLRNYKNMLFGGCNGN